MPSDKIELDLKSSVMQEFGAQIEAAVREVLEQFGVTACKLFLEDKGALDCTIKARVETVLRRANEK
jgi:citrate lyase acyl carrier protein